MAGEKIMEKSVTAELKSKSSTELIYKEMVTGKDGKSSDSISSISSVVGATTGLKGSIAQGVNNEHVSYYQMANCCDYYYPGYGNFNNGQGIQSDNGFYIYYMPGYNPYTAEFISSDGKQQPYTTTGYLQQPIAYGLDGLPYYSWCLTNSDMTYGTAPKSKGLKSIAGTNGSVKSNSFNSSKNSKNSQLSLNYKAHQFTSTNFSKPSLQSQPLKQLNKLNSGFLPYTNQNNGCFNHYGPINNYQTNGRAWSGNYKFKSRDNSNRNGTFDASTELTCGPRASGRCSSSKPSSVEGEVRISSQNKKYNSEDFRTEYDNAKFYVIKSYSEDDIHKSVKYGVWSSTLNGNKKLNRAFCDANETGAKCPVFLFFSVNGSGQFLGVAEMTEQVDFTHKKDFWQLDKWTGFFAVKWHIVKDVPNTQLRHIILENNDNKPVTYSRDTQEVGLKKGLEMLNIFKSYSEKSSLLDDFEFYDEREKSLKASRSCKPGVCEASVFQNRDSHKKLGEGEMKSREESAGKTGISESASSLVGLTEGLSINS